MEPHLGPPGPRCQHLPTIPLRLKKIKKKRRLARLVSRGAGRHAASSLSTVNEPENARDAAAEMPPPPPWVRRPLPRNPLQLTLSTVRERWKGGWGVGGGSTRWTDVGNMRGPVCRPPALDPKPSTSIDLYQMSVERKGARM